MGKETTSSCSKVFLKYSIEYANRQAGMMQIYASGLGGLFTFASMSRM